MAAQAQQSNGVTSCDAPGGRQTTGAVIGGVLGALAGSRISSNERALGAVAGGAAGAAAGSYIGCNQQRARANSQASSSGAQYRASSNLRIRSGPGTSYRQAGQPVCGPALHGCRLAGRMGPDRRRRLGQCELRAALLG